MSPLKIASIIFTTMAIGCYDGESWALRSPAASASPSLCRKILREHGYVSGIMDYLARHDTLPERVDYLFLFGNDDLTTIFRALGYIVSKQANIMVITGGIGRLTESLRQEIRTCCPDIEGSGHLTEAQTILQLYLKIAAPTGFKLDLRKFMLENYATNTKENSILAIRRCAIMPGQSILLMQRPTQQLRAYYTLRKTLDDMGLDSVSVYNRVAYTPKADRAGLLEADKEIERMRSYSIKGDMYEPEGLNKYDWRCQQ